MCSFCILKLNIGFVSYPFHESLIYTSYLCQGSFGYGIGIMENTSGFYIRTYLSHKIPTKPLKKNVIVCFKVNMIQKYCQVSINGENYGTIFDNIPAAIVPAVSNNTDSCEVSIETGEK